MATTIEDVVRILGEIAVAQQSAQTENRRMAQETERMAQETERRFQEMAEQFRETERLVQQQNQKLNEQLGKLGNRLGEFVEWQVRPAVVKLFQDRGIAVHEFHDGVSVQRGDEGIEIDLLVVNTTDAVLVEVKSKLTQLDVDEHLERLSQFERLMPRYQDVQAMGAVAGMVVPSAETRYAYRQGLFVLAQSGNSVVILNDDKFQPHQW
jgi:hypothetical protein